MTPEELEAVVLGGNLDEVVRLLGGASERERLASGARMARLRKAHGDWPFNARSPQINETTLIALLGTGSAAQIQAGRRMWRHATAGTVLRLRPAELLAELGPWMLDRMGWRFVRELVRDGACPRPSVDAYISGMLDFSIDATTLLHDDSDLLDHEVWRLFEVEGTADHSLADHDKYTPEAKSWARALLALAAVPSARERLLEASLAALERDFPAFRAGWYSRFHESLMPTTTERSARAGAYLRLLRSPIPPTVTFAVRALTELQRAGELDDASLLAHLEPAMTARAAGTARQAVRLAAEAARRDPSLARAAARAGIAALAHPSTDVQSAAIALLESVLPAVGNDIVPAIAARRRDVAASVLPRLDSLVGERPATDGDEREGERSSDRTTPAPVTASRERHASDPFAGLVRLEPVASLDGLVELLAGVLEREGPPEDLELALDGVLRFSGPRPADFGRMTQAIRVRSERLLAARRGQRISTWFASLIGAWIDGAPPADADPRAAGTVAAYLARRVADAARVASRGQPATLVSLPSYAGGWIEPTELIARLVADRRQRDGDEQAMPLDLPQALLRVLPVRRERALEDASQLEGEVGHAVRHALGGDAVVGPTAALWAAAARCRAPGGDDLAVVAAHPGLGPDAGRAGRYSLVVSDGRWMREVRVDPGVPAGNVSTDIASDLLWRTSANFGRTGDDGPLVDWMRLIWPQDRRSWFAVSAALMLGNIDWWEARWHERQRLGALFEPWIPLDREAGLLLAVALQAKEPGERGLAVDAASSAVDAGRLPAEVLVRGFDEVATALEPQPLSAHPITLFRPRRLAASLDAIARRSDVQRAWALEVAAGALARIVATRQPKPIPVGQMLPLLRLLIELTAAAGSRTPRSASAALETLAAGSGEAARLAKRLLEAASATPA